MKLPVGMSLKEEMWVSLRTISGRTGVPDEDRSLMSRTAHRLSPAARQCKVQEGGQFSTGCAWHLSRHVLRYSEDDGNEA